MTAVIYQEINQMRQDATAAIEQATSLDALEQCRVTYLGRKGGLAGFMAGMKDLDVQEKKARGKLLNDVKRSLTTLLQDKQTELAGSATSSAPKHDVTLPGAPWPVGRRHVLQSLTDEISNVFGQMGFDIEAGSEVEDEFHNFDALNIPQSHMARSAEDNFYLSGEGLLRSQTSPVQIRTMERRNPPLRIIAPGRVYRPDTVDATHHFMFHQIEGLMVGEDVSFADLVACLSLWARRMFGDSTEVRFRPHHFPFTEPSAEMDISCQICKESSGRCPVCGGNGWLEILGCGMVHPNVFKAVNYDTDKYTGFAFGMGVERIAMMRYGINDIRYFIENDVRFLKQF